MTPRVELILKIMASQPDIVRIELVKGALTGELCDVYLDEVFVFNAFAILGQRPSATIADATDDEKYKLWEAVQAHRAYLQQQKDVQLAALAAQRSSELDANLAAIQQKYAIK